MVANAEMGAIVTRKGAATIGVIVKKDTGVHTVKNVYRVAKENAGTVVNVLKLDITSIDASANQDTLANSA